VETPVVVEVPGGPTLEAHLDFPDSAAAGLVLCHPHPLYGGDMDNPVIIRAAEVAQSLGVSTLRFNFRGVGRSTGVHDEGGGEQDDCSAALASLRSRLAPTSPLGLLGYSFGARIAAQVGEGRADLDGLALVAPPLAMYSFDGLPAGRPLLLVAGSRDPYCPVQDLVKLAERVGTEPRIIEGADHFFFGKLFPLGTAVEGWLRGWVPGRSS
jgi:alpha/beta superfamily hydrolase